MTSMVRRLKFIESYLRNARERIKLARISAESGFYNNAVRLCQESVELSLKAALRLYGIEYPKSHEVGHVLREYSQLFPEWFRELIPEMARISRDLSFNRGPAMYGDESSETPPEELYDEEDSQVAIEKAMLVHGYCLKLLEERRRELSAELQPPS